MRPTLLLPLLAAGCWPYIPADGPAGSGAGALGELAWNDTLGSYWDTESGRVPGTGRAVVGFFEFPADVHWWTVFGPSLEDTCVRNYQLPPYPFIDVGVDTVTLDGPTADTTLTWNAELEVFLGTLGSSTWAPNAPYAIAPFSSTVYGDVSVSPVGTTNAKFNLTAPALDTADPIELGVNDLAFTWGGAVADRVVIEVVMSDGVNALESVSCSAVNDGQFSIPPEQWTSWRAGQTLYIDIHAIVEDGGEVSFNRGESRVAGRYTIGGAAFTR